MKMFSKKMTALLLALILVATLVPFASVSAKSSDKDVAVLMMATAHARINGISSIDQLKGMRSGYRDHYDNLLNNADLDDDQKLQIVAIRDEKIDALDEKIDDLEKAQRRRQRARSPIGILGSVFRGGKRVVQGAGRIVGKGIEIAGKTMVRTIRDPRQLVKTAVMMIATGGVSSFKDAVITIVKSEVKREAKKAAYAELARAAYRNPALRKAVRLKEFLGIEGNEDLEAALEAHFKKQQQAEDSGSDWGDIGYEGEGGYDDPATSASVDIGPEGEGGYDDPDGTADYSGIYMLEFTLVDAVFTRHPYTPDSGFANEAEYNAYLDEVIAEMQTADYYEDWRNPSGGVELLHDTAQGTLTLSLYNSGLVEVFLFDEGERSYRAQFDGDTISFAGKNANGDTAYGSLTFHTGPDGKITITGTWTVFNPGSMGDVQRTFEISGTAAGI